MDVGVFVISLCLNAYKSSYTQHCIQVGNNSFLVKAETSQNCFYKIPVPVLQSVISKCYVYIFSLLRTASCREFTFPSPEFTLAP